MPTIDDKKIERLQKLLELTSEDYATPEELIQAVKGILDIIEVEKNKLAKEIVTESNRQRQEYERTISVIENKQDRLQYLITQLSKSVSDDNELVSNKFSKEVKRLEKKIPSRVDLTGIYAEIEDIKAGLTTIPTEITANPESIRNALELLQGDERLDKSAIRGLDETIKTTAQKYHNDGIGLVVRQLVAGSGVTIDNSNQEYPIITSTGGGGGMSIETPTGTVNGSNTAFTATSTPKFIITDTGTYVQNFGFTLSGLNITMDLGPNTFIRSFY